MNMPTQVDHPSSYRNDGVELSVVIPLFNETAVLGLLHLQLKAVLTPLGINHELLFVDDGSSDGTAEALLNMSHHDPAITVVALTHHFGKEAALTAGLAQASGQTVVIMDGDLQDPPELLPEMLAAWHDGADVVLMRRRQPAETSLFRRLAGRGLNRLLNATCDVSMPENSVDFMLYGQKAVAALDLVVERKRYMKPIFDWVGFRVTEIEYERARRAVGSSKWSLRETFGFANTQPSSSIDVSLQSLMLTGLFTVLAGLFYACYTVTAAIPGSEAETFSLAQPIQALTWGGLLFCSGWLAKRIIRACTYARRPVYSIYRLSRSSAATAHHYRKRPLCL
jgi:glycosyltransferase involved in cell wall biosynthesis